MDPLDGNLDRATWFTRVAQGIQALDVGRRADVPEELATLRERSERRAPE